MTANRPLPPNDLPVMKAPYDVYRNESESDKENYRMAKQMREKEKLCTQTGNKQLTRRITHGPYYVHSFHAS